jgi:hypothetical protein
MACGYRGVPRTGGLLHCLDPSSGDFAGLQACSAADCMHTPHVLSHTEVGCIAKAASGTAALCPLRSRGHGPPACKRPGSQPALATMVRKRKSAQKVAVALARSVG